MIPDDHLLITFELPKLPEMTQSEALAIRLKKAIVREPRSVWGVRPDGNILQKGFDLFRLMIIPAQMSAPVESNTVRQLVRQLSGALLRERGNELAMLKEEYNAEMNSLTDDQLEQRQPVAEYYERERGRICYEVLGRVEEIRNTAKRERRISSVHKKAEKENRQPSESELAEYSQDSGPSLLANVGRVFGQRLRSARQRLEEQDIWGRATKYIESKTRKTSETIAVITQSTLDSIAGYKVFGWNNERVSKLISLLARRVEAHRTGEGDARLIGGAMRWLGRRAAIVGEGVQKLEEKLIEDNQFLERELLGSAIMVPLIVSNPYNLILYPLRWNIDALVAVGQSVAGSNTRPGAQNPVGRWWVESLQGLMRPGNKEWELYSRRRQAEVRASKLRQIVEELGRNRSTNMSIGRKLEALANYERGQDSLEVVRHTVRSAITFGKLLSG